jgi:hypothetical protein
MPEQHFLAKAPERRATLVGSPDSRALLMFEVSLWQELEQQAERHGLRAVPSAIATHDNPLGIEPLTRRAPVGARHYLRLHSGQILWLR